MRPHQLIPLFASAKSLAGIGPRMEILLNKALRLPPGVSEPRVIDLLWHAPTGVIDRRATPTVAAAVPGTIATLEVRVLKHKPSPARQHAGALQGRLRGRHRPHRPRVLPRRAQVHRAPAAGRRHPLHQRPHRELQRHEADGASRLHRRAGGARRSAAAGAGLSADRRPVRQGAAEGRAAGPGARPDRCPNGRTPPGSSSAAGPMPHRARPPAPPRGPGRRLAGLAALEAARLRRAAGGPAGAGPGAPEPQVAGGRSVDGRRPHPRPHRRCAALRADQLAAPGAEGDRRGHGAPRSACCACCRATSARARRWWR